MGGSRRHRFAALLAAFITAVAGLVVWASPASAAPSTFTAANGIEYSYTGYSAFVNGYAGSSKSVVIPARVLTPDGNQADVVSILEKAFSGKSLTSLVVGTNVRAIGNDAFRDNSLTQVRIPASVTAIGSEAFGKNTGLSRVVFDGGAPRVTKSGAGASFDTTGGLTVSFWRGASGFTSGSWEGYRSRALTRGSCEVALFTDTPSGIFCAPVTWLAGQGITDGYGDGTFRPLGEISREAMAAFLFRYANPGARVPACSAATFNDISGSAFCGEIAWLGARGLSKPYPDGGFHPSDVISRQAVATQLYRLVHQSTAVPSCPTNPTFPDVGRGNGNCGAIEWLAAKDITAGYDDGGFHPTDPVSRQAMAAFLYRVDGL